MLSEPSTVTARPDGPQPLATFDDCSIPEPAKDGGRKKETGLAPGFS
jgi:hypothetical protein